MPLSWSNSGGGCCGIRPCIRSCIITSGGIEGTGATTPTVFRNPGVCRLSELSIASRTVAAETLFAVSGSGSVWSPTAR